MKRIIAAIEVLYVGHALTDSTRWKDAQLWASLLLAIFGLIETFGWVISENTLNGIALTLGALTNAFLTVATTKKIGLPAAPEDSR